MTIHFRTSKKQDTTACGLLISKGKKRTTETSLITGEVSCVKCKPAVDERIADDARDEAQSKILDESFAREEAALMLMVAYKTQGKDIEAVKLRWIDASREYGRARLGALCNSLHAEEFFTRMEKYLKEMEAIVAEVGGQS